MFVYLLVCCLHACIYANGQKKEIERTIEHYVHHLHPVSFNFRIKFYAWSWNFKIWIAIFSKQTNNEISSSQYKCKINCNIRYRKTLKYDISLKICLIVINSFILSFATFKIYLNLNLNSQRKKNHIMRQKILRICIEINNYIRIKKSAKNLVYSFFVYPFYFVFSMP